MADQGKVIERYGTAIVMGESGATVGGRTVTHTMALDNLSSAGAWMSASADLGADMPEELLIEMYIETGTAPTVGLLAEGYIASSSNNSGSWPGKVTGSSAAYPSTITANKLQLGPPTIMLVATNDGNTVLIQQSVRIKTPGRYLAAVLHNLLGQGLRNETTNSDNGSGFVIIPIYRFIVDP